MKKVLIDTCIVIDFLQKREPFADDALRFFRAAASELFAGYITAKSATDIYYIDHKATHSDAESRKKLRSLLTIISMADSAAIDVFQALASGISDFEDAVMAETAKRIGADCIVTRNIKDYDKAAVPVCTPAEFLDALFSSDEELE
ncbi:PIN domain-containing protein [Syntrophomonas curvata]